MPKYVCTLCDHERTIDLPPGADPATAVIAQHGCRDCSPDILVETWFLDAEDRKLPVP